MIIKNLFTKSHLIIVQLWKSEAAATLRSKKKKKTLVTFIADTFEGYLLWNWKETCKRYISFFERTVSAASDFKNCMVVNSEIIFFYFVSDWNIFCKNMKYHFLVFHLCLVFHRNGDTIYCTCRKWHNGLLLAFDKSSDFVCFNHLSRELGLVLTNGLAVFFSIPVGMRLRNFIISNILYYEWTVFLSRFMENEFHKIFWRPICGGDIKILFFIFGFFLGKATVSWLIHRLPSASQSSAFTHLWTCIALLLLDEMATSIQALYLGHVSFQELHQLKTFLTASCFIILMAFMLLWRQRL